MASKAEKKKNVNYAVWFVFAVCFIGYSALMYRLFYEQAIHWQTRELYFSDSKAYLETILGLECDYDFPYPVYFLLGKFFLLFMNIAAAASLAATLLNSLGVVLLFYYMRKFIKTYCKRYDFQNDAGAAALILTYGIFFNSMLYLPGRPRILGITGSYLGVFTPNPYHNITYMAARPFAVLAFFLYAGILEYYEERTDKKEFALFGASLLLATLTKPSYTLILISAAGLVMLWRLFQSGGKNCKRSFYLGLSFVPTFIALLYQFGGVFGETSKAGEDGGIGIRIGAVWKLYTNNIPLAIILALGFPLLVLLFHWKELKNNVCYCFSWVQLLVSMAQMLLFYEKGRRMSDANFAWGYMYGIFFVFVTSLLVLMEDTIGRRRKNDILRAQWILYALHLACGIGYFLYIWEGGAFHEF